MLNSSNNFQLARIWFQQKPIVQQTTHSKKRPKWLINSPKNSLTFENNVDVLIYNFCPVVILQEKVHTEINECLTQIQKNLK